METMDAPSTGGLMAAGAGVMIFYLVFIVAIYAAMWMIFTKAGKPGWAAIVPIYNLIVMCEIVGKPGWWWLLMFIPIVGIYFAIVLLHRLSVSFGQGAGTTILMFVFGIGYMILGFGSAKYVGAPAN